MTYKTRPHREICGLCNRVSPVDFARERLGIWPADLSTGYRVIPAEAWEDARDPEAEIIGPPAFSVDVSPDRSRASISASSGHFAANSLSCFPVITPPPCD